MKRNLLASLSLSEWVETLICCLKNKYSDKFSTETGCKILCFTLKSVFSSGLLNRGSEPKAINQKKEIIFRFNM